MENDSILSLTTGGRSPRPAVASPSPVLDLIYACFYLHGLKGSGREPLEWARDLRRDHPTLAADAAALVVKRERGSALFAMALEVGYAFDEDPSRFLADVPKLPELLRDFADSHEGPKREKHKKGKKGQKEEAHANLPSWLKDPPDAAWSEGAASVLSRLWGELLPVWESSGRRAAEAAANDVSAGLEENGDVMRALPRRHFAQFEDVSASLREAFERGRLRIVPLAFAEGGGFHLQGDEITAVGFGLHGERIYEAIERRVSKAAERAKALADPTRLMLLSLIMRYDSMPLTVGDLARQLGVSQPTVSGHLKLLRESGLITTERKGNRTFPKPNEGEIGETVAALTDVLRP